MEHLELVLLGLLVVIAGLAALAQAIRVPYPIALVVGGLLLGFLPEADEIRLDPDLVLVLFLPPLLYAAAFFSNPREFARNVRPISLLAIGLVVATSPPSRSSRTRSSACPGRSRSCSGRSSPPRTRSRPPRSSGASASRGAW